MMHLDGMFMYLYFAQFPDLENLPLPTADDYEDFDDFDDEIVIGSDELDDDSDDLEEAIDAEGEEGEEKENASKVVFYIPTEIELRKYLIYLATHHGAPINLGMVTRASRTVLLDVLSCLIKKYGRPTADQTQTQADVSCQ